MVEMSGGIAAPLLAGFSLTTVILLLTSSDRPWLAEEAIASFSIAAVLFLNAVQYSALTLSYAATPAERLDFNPEASSDRGVLSKVVDRQWEESDTFGRAILRATFCYNVGMAGFLIGLGLCLASPPAESWPFFGWGRLIAISVIAVALLFEVVWTMSDGRWPGFMLPHTAKTAPTHSDEVYELSAAHLFGAERNQDAFMEEVVGLLTEINRKLQ